MIGVAVGREEIILVALVQKLRLNIGDGVEDEGVFVQLDNKPRMMQINDFHRILPNRFLVADG